MGSMVTLLQCAACEWLVLFLLMVDGVLSYLLTKLARSCKLQTPCILCSRLDHIWGVEKPGFYHNLLCVNHTSEISCFLKKSRPTNPTIPFPPRRGRFRAQIGSYESQLYTHLNLTSDSESDDANVTTTTVNGPKGSFTTLIKYPSRPKPHQLTYSGSSAIPQLISLLDSAPSNAAGDTEKHKPQLPLTHTSNTELLSLVVDAPSSLQNKSVTAVDTHTSDSQTADMAEATDAENPTNVDAECPTNVLAENLTSVDASKASELETEMSSVRESEKLSRDIKPLPVVHDSVSPRKTDHSGVLENNNQAESVITQLKQQLEYDKKCINELYAELEEERNASAIAADEAMAMITRLQEEKASLHMEALQYLRMMEEQAEYDVEALEKANDLLAEREKELQDLEAELEFLRMNYLPEEPSAMSTNKIIPGEAKDEKEKSCADITGVTSTTTEEPIFYGKSTLSVFAEEKMYISQYLKGLERKLGRFADDEELNSWVGNENSAAETKWEEPDVVNIENEISDLNERLEALEGDWNLLEHTFNSLQNGKEGLKFVEEIARQLQELRTIARNRCQSVT